MTQVARIERPPLGTPLNVCIGEDGRIKFNYKDFAPTTDLIHAIEGGNDSIMQDLPAVCAAVAELQPFEVSVT